ncbi:uncharacterized protein LOC141839719 isoform X2 [Curcuma longa]|uniref:uncharacterized protein LOC141839719 isoform X2 n=1 Tax=Curcuma longa TaxID=136217 RepID=UPI003D9F25FB
MATTEQRSSTYGKTGPETGNGGGAGFAERRPPTNLFRVDFLLRLLLLASSVSALVVLVTSKQSRQILTGLPPPLAVVSREAKFQHSPAFIYLLAALCVSSLYSFVTMFASFLSISIPSPSTRILFLLLVCDALMAGVMASAMGSAGSIAYLGLRGNSHANWAKICNNYAQTRPGMLSLRILAASRSRLAFVFSPLPDLASSKPRWPDLASSSPLFFDAVTRAVSSSISRSSSGRFGVPDREEFGFAFSASRPFPTFPICGPNPNLIPFSSQNSLDFCRKASDYWDIIVAIEIRRLPEPYHSCSTSPLTNLSRGDGSFLTRRTTKGPP